MSLYSILLDILIVGGSFNEIIRMVDDCTVNTENFVAMMPGDVKQVNYSEVLPGAIKAGHYHLKQEDYWFVTPRSRLLVGLKDLREDSPTFGSVMRIVMGDGKAQLLVIPEGVLHGVANLGQESGDLFYFTTNHFNIEDPDEYRLSPEEFGEAFWEIQKG